MKRAIVLIVLGSLGVLYYVVHIVIALWTPWVYGFVCGLWVGATFGAFIVGLCKVSADAERHIEFRGVTQG